MIEFLEETNWLVVTIIYVVFLIILWKMTFWGSTEAVRSLRLLKIGISIIMLPIITVIVNRMGE